MRKIIGAIAAFFLCGALKWAFDHFLWDLFVQYLEMRWHITEATVIASVLSYIVPLLVTFLSVLVIYWLARHPAVLRPQPDMPINEAIDYIVNDSTADLKQPEPPKIATSGPAMGQIVVQSGVEHSDARAEMNGKANMGALRVWGRRQIDDLPNQFEHSQREIPREYWDNMQLNFLSCFHFNDRSPQTFEIPRVAAGAPHYTDLRVSKAQVHALWPPKSFWKRAYAKLTRKPRITYWRAGVRDGS